MRPHEAKALAEARERELRILAELLKVAHKDDDDYYEEVA